MGYCSMRPVSKGYQRDFLDAYQLIDFVDTGHPALRRMWDNRQRGYRSMGYRINDVQNLI